jgi:hypothetical protein
VRRTHGNILAMPLAGGTPTTLVTMQMNPARLIVDGTSLYWLDNGSLGIDCTPTDGRIASVSLAGGAPVMLAWNLAGAGDFTVVGGIVYYSTVGAWCNALTTPLGSVVKIPKGGGLMNLATLLWSPGSLVVDGKTLFFTTTELNGAGVLNAAAD